MDNKQIIINIVRHAYSCSNIVHGDKLIGYTDNTNIGYNHKINTNIKRIPLTTMDYMNKMPELIESYTSHPNLSFLGMQQAIYMGLEFMNKLDPDNEQYDIVLASPSVRTIMTALVSLRSLSINQTRKQKIYVVPFIHEECGILGTLDYENMPLDSVRLRRLMSFIKDWLGNDWIRYYDDIELIDNLHKLKEDIEIVGDDRFGQYIDIIDRVLECKPNQYFSKVECKIDVVGEMRNIGSLFESKEFDGHYLKSFFGIFDNDDSIREYFAGPDIDYSILEAYEKRGWKPVKGSIDEYKKLYSDLLPYLVSHGYIDKNNTTTRILVYTHGDIMKSYYEHQYNEKMTDRIMNTQILEEIIMPESENNTINFSKYHPVDFINEFKNFAALNMDICTNGSILGVINNVLWHDGSKLEQRLACNNNKTDLNVDMRGVCLDDYYRAKYLKYKRKYLKYKKIN